MNIKEAVREYKIQMNGDSRDKSYPQSLKATERSVLHWCSSECIDVEGVGLHCPCNDCPLHEVYEGLLSPNKRT